MSDIAIPNWNPKGVLPPISSCSQESAARSPYLVSLTDFVLRFGTSLERKTILEGFLDFRSALHAAGLTRGFHWVDGSFLENIEIIESRSPHDIDVVTFFRLPPGQTQVALSSSQPRLFDPARTKADYHVHAYFVQLNADAPEALVSQSAYWYSLWSHRRDEQWKGYLQIALSQADEHVAKANLDKLVIMGGQP